MSFRILVSSAALMALTACGGGGPGAPTFAQLVAEANDLSARLGGVADTTTLPAAGTGVFEGIIVLADDFGPSTTGYTGDVAIVVDFGASTLDGTAGGFYESTIDAGGTPSGVGTAIAGSLTFADTGMVAGDDGVTPTVSGTLEVAGNVETVNGDMTGEFGTEVVNADFLVLSHTGAGLAVGGGPIPTLDAALIAAR